MPEKCNKIDKRKHHINNYQLSIIHYQFKTQTASNERMVCMVSGS